MSSLGLFITGTIVFIYMGLNAWPEARISRFLLSTFGPSPENGERRTSFLVRVATYSFSWTMVFVLIGVGSLKAMSSFGLEFKSDTEELVYFFFVWAAAAYLAWIVLRSLINILFLKVAGRDWVYEFENHLD